MPNFFPKSQAPAGPGRAYRDPGIVEAFSQFLHPQDRVAAYAQFPVIPGEVHWKRRAPAILFASVAK